VKCKAKDYSRDVGGYGITLGEAIKALEEGKKVIYRARDGQWFPFELNNSLSVQYLRRDCEFRLAEPEQTEAEKRLEKWKGKRMCLPSWKSCDWFEPAHSDGYYIYGITNEGKEDFWRIDSDKWQEWTPPKRTAKEWLTELPEHIQEELPPEGHKAWKGQAITVHPSSLGEALVCSTLKWNKTDQGYDFWNAVYKATQGKQRYPVKVTRTVTPAELAGKWVASDYGRFNAVLAVTEATVFVFGHSIGINVERLCKRYQGYADTPKSTLKPFTVEEWDLCPEEEKE